MPEYDEPQRQILRAVPVPEISSLGSVEEDDFGSNADRAAALADGSLAQTEAPLVATPVEEQQAAEQDPFVTKMDEELSPLLTTLEGAETANARETSAQAVATWTRSNMIDQTELQSYLARTDITWDEKTATLGQLAVETARSEFLAGWSNEGGVNNGGTNGWENVGSNRGAFPSYYQDQVRTYDRANGAEWCTSFAGHTMGRMGFQYNQDTGADNSHSIFWSGYRLNHWAETGQSNSETQLTPAGREVDQGTEGSRYTDSGAWSDLRNDLRGANTDEARELATTEFLTNNATPQAGDIMVLGNNNDYRKGGKSHTVMVESYDAENQVIYTIEGNAGNAVTSRRIDLRNATDAAQIVSSVRIGASMFVDQETRDAVNAGTAPTVDPERGPVTAEQLLDRARGVNSRLVGAASREGYIESDDEDASAYMWLHGNTDASDETLGVQ